MATHASASVRFREVMKLSTVSKDSNKHIKRHGRRLKPFLCAKWGAYRSVIALLLFFADFVYSFVNFLFIFLFRCATEKCACFNTESRVNCPYTPNRGSIKD